MEALNILYIGHNEKFISDYRFNHEKIEVAVQKENGFLAFKYLMETKKK